MKSGLQGQDLADPCQRGLQDHQPLLYRRIVIKHNEINKKHIIYDDDDGFNWASMGMINVSLKANACEEVDNVC